jgi:hypothetical protein
VSVLRKLHQSCLIAGGIFLLCVPVASASAAVTEVLYPAAESDKDVRYNDLIEILQGALARTQAEFGPFRMAPSPVRMSEARQLATLKGQGPLSVMWSSTSMEKERDMQAIRIPLRKGLLGYRIALIRQDRQAAMDQVRTLHDLSRLRIGQGAGWGDIAIYAQNGFAVTAVRYDQLFPMLAAGRFDLFPRGIGEVFKEYAAQGGAASGLAVERHLLLVYPWPYYFFVRKNDQRLARRIEKGVRSMMKDGSFDAIFWKYNASDIQRANLRNRVVLRLRNPLLPPDTPLNDPDLWFDPLQKTPPGH